MSELRERLREAAEAAAREGRTPTAAALVARGRRRRLRLVGGTAALVVLAMVAGTAGIGRLSDRHPRTQAPSASLLQVTYAGGGGGRRIGVVSGTVTNRAVRLPVLFRKGPPMEVTPVEAGDEFPVNFWAGLFLETGSPPPGGQMPELAVDRILAFDQAGKQVAACRARLGPGNTCQL
ncbi:MAG TPA: hypothetical protein VJB61_10955 [Actinomycetota bacterium]